MKCKEKQLLAEEEKRIPGCQGLEAVQHVARAELSWGELKMGSQVRRDKKKSPSAKTAARRPVKKAAAKKGAVKPNSNAPQDKIIHELILSHRESGRKLGRSLLRRWRVVLPQEEIDSHVDLALCEAARRYSAEKGASFITFFFYHLRGYLVRAVATAANDSAGFLAIAQSVGVDTSEWATYTEENVQPLIPEFSGELEKGADSPEVLLMKKERAKVARAACDTLDELEREVIERSYAQDEALVDIAKSLGYSRCHISRVKKRALDRLKDHIVENGSDVVDTTSSVETEIELLERENEERRAGRRTRRRRFSHSSRTRRETLAA